jgi:hypothetical protein
MDQHMTVDEFVDRFEKSLNDDDDMNLDDVANDDFMPTANDKPNSKFKPRRSSRPRKKKDPMNDEDLEAMDNEIEERAKRNTNITSLSYEPINKNIEKDEYFDTSCDELEIKEAMSRKRNRDSLYDMDDISDDDDENDEEIKKRALAIRKRNHYTNCFACSYGNARDVEINPDFANICTRIYEENYGKMGDYYVAKMIHEFHKEVIYKPNAKNGTFPIWRTRTVMEHMQEHVMDPRIFVGQSIRRLKRDINDLSKMKMQKTTRADGTVITEVATKNYMAYLKTHDLVMKLYSSKVEGMNFWNQDSGLNLAYAGGMFTVNQRWSFANKRKKT